MDDLDRFWQWADKPLDSRLTIPADIHHAVTSLPTGSAARPRQGQRGRAHGTRDRRRNYHDTPPVKPDLNGRRSLHQHGQLRPSAMVKIDHIRISAQSNHFCSLRLADAAFPL
jgi:hypothetical protein